MTDDTIPTNEMTTSNRQEESAAQAGRAWADAVRSELQLEGRRASGGWPGTISEARTRMEHLIGFDSPLSKEQRSSLTRVLYGAAKQYWHINREPSAPEE